MPRAPRRVLSHWHHLVPEFSTSALAFYDVVEERVKETEAPDLEFSRVEWSEKGIFSAKRTYLRVARGRLNFDICAAPYGKGYFFSWWLAETPSYAAFLHLIILIGSLAMISSGILFEGVRSGSLGCGTFVFLTLLWLLALPAGLIIAGRMVAEGSFGDEEMILATPYIGRLYGAFFNPKSYYRLDTAAMFQETVRQAVGDTVNATIAPQGLHALSDEALRPVFERLGGER